MWRGKWQYCSRSLYHEVGGPAELLDFVSQIAPPGNWRNSTMAACSRVSRSVLRRLQYAQQVGYVASDCSSFSGTELLRNRGTIHLHCSAETTERRRTVAGVQTDDRTLALRPWVTAAAPGEHLPTGGPPALRLAKTDDFHAAGPTAVTSCRATPSDASAVDTMTIESIELSGLNSNASFLSVASSVHVSFPHTCDTCQHFLPRRQFVP